MHCCIQGRVVDIGKRKDKTYVFENVFKLKILFEPKLF